MVKRLRGAALKHYNEKRRREAEAAEAANQDPVVPGNDQPTPPVKTATELLTECAEKQKKFIEDMNIILPIWNDRRSRLVHYKCFLDDSNERISNLEELNDQVKKAEAECEALEKKEEQLWESINSMKEQETRLEKVFQEAKGHQNCQADLPEKDNDVRTIMPNQHEIYSMLNSFRTLNELLVDSRGDALPDLLPDDFDEIQWPILRIANYSQHFDEGTDLARECLQRDNEIKDMRIWLEKGLYHNIQANKNKIEHLHENPQIREILFEAQTNSIKTEFQKWKSLVKKIHIRKASIATFKQEETRLSALQESRDSHFERLRELVNEEQYKCEMCVQLMTNGDGSTRCPKMFGSCGHTVCAECMIRFETGDEWRCPECRTFSSEIVTNWTLMRQINPSWQQERNDLIYLD